MFPSRLTGSRRTLTPCTQTIDSQLNVKPLVVKHVVSAPGLPQRKGISPGSAECYPQTDCKLKICAKCFLCHSIVLCENCSKCHECCLKSTCRGKTSKLLASLAKSGRRSESSSNPQRGLHPPLSDPAQTNKISHCRKLLCKSPQEQLPAGGIASAYRPKRSRSGTKSKISGFLQPTIFSPKTKQQMETYTRSEQTQSFPQGGDVQHGNAGNHPNFSSARGVGDLDRLQGCLLPYTNTGTVQEISEISCRGSDVPVQSLALWPIHSTHVVHCDNQRGKLMAIHKGIRIHQYLDDWLVRATSHQDSLQHTQVLVQICQDLGWMVNLEKSELEPKQVFDFVVTSSTFRSVGSDLHRSGGKVSKKRYRDFYPYRPVRSRRSCH